MAIKEVVSGLYQVSKGGINSFLIDKGVDGLTLIDSGLPDHAEMLTEGIRSIGREPSDLTNILITHAHPDHLGSAKTLSKSRPEVCSAAVRAGPSSSSRMGARAFGLSRLVPAHRPLAKSWRGSMPPMS